MTLRRADIRRDGPGARRFASQRSEFRPDPDKVREFIDNTRTRARERALAERRSSTLRPGQRKRKVAIPKAVRRRVLKRSGGLCICGCQRKATQLHHVLDETKFPELALVEDNLAGIFHDCNQRHHFQPNGRIPRERLPACAVRLASTHPRYQVFLERTYPETEA